MRRELQIGLGLALLIVAGGLWMVLSVNKASQMVLDGKIQKVRLWALDENATAVIVDFRVANPTDFKFMVREVRVAVDAGGKVHEVEPVADVDAKALFDGYPQIGEKYNDTMRMKTIVPSKATQDYMVAVRVEQPIAMVEKRKDLKLRIEEVDGLTTELVEQR
jgi:hypothetical protein